MCGRYTLTKLDELYELMDIERPTFSFEPRFNIAPSQKLPVIVHQEKNVLRQMRWGLIPAWATSDKVPFATINARAETILDRSMYKTAFLKGQRCLIPATGFFEWKDTDKGKFPHYFEPSNTPLFCFAGLYDIWIDKEGREVPNYTIITTTPNKIVGAVHDRMPVILHPDQGEEWIDPANTDKERLLSLLQTYPESEMKEHEVSKALNNPSYDNASLIQ